jgi:hypothetical protein
MGGTNRRRDAAVAEAAWAVGQGQADVAPAADQGRVGAALAVGLDPAGEVPVADRAPVGGGSVAALGPFHVGSVAGHEWAARPRRR